MFTQIKKSLLLTLIIATASTPLVAKETKIQTEYTTVHLTETVTAPLKNMDVVAKLLLNVSSRSKTKTEEKLNNTMEKAIELIRTDTRLRFYTGEYRTAQDHKNKWKTHQSLVLESIKKKPLLDMVAQLQGMGFELKVLDEKSNDREYKRNEQLLLKEATDKIQKKAQIIAAQLKKSNVHISEMHIHSRQRAAMEASTYSLSKKRSTPSVHSKEERITVEVRATVLIN